MPPLPLRKCLTPPDRSQMFIHGLTNKELIDILSKLDPNDKPQFCIVGTQECYEAEKAEIRSVEGNYGVIGSEVFDMPVVFVRRTINEHTLDRWDTEVKTNQWQKG